jgi:hypothetical protein
MPSDGRDSPTSVSEPLSTVPKRELTQLFPWLIEIIKQYADTSKHGCFRVSLETLQGDMRKSDFFSSMVPSLDLTGRYWAHQPFAPQMVNIRKQANTWFSRRAAGKRGKLAFIDGEPLHFNPDQQELGVHLPGW